MALFIPCWFSYTLIIHIGVEVINLPQFEKHIKGRKNEKHPVFKEEERIVATLKKLRDEGKIDPQLYKKMEPIGSQPARLYGLAKVHKATVPLRPVLSMLGSAYHKVGLQVAEWLSVVPECKINCSTKTISDMLGSIHLEDDEELVSFDVSSLYTNVPVMEAIDTCTDLLFNGEHDPPVDRDTFQNSCPDIFMQRLDANSRRVLQASRWPSNG